MISRFLINKEFLKEKNAPKQQNYLKKYFK